VASRAAGQAKVTSTKKLSIDLICGNNATLGAQNDAPETIVLARANQKFLFVIIAMHMLPKRVVLAFHNSTMLRSTRESDPPP
jgi:hypothetical protein